MKIKKLGEEHRAYLKDYDKVKTNVNRVYENIYRQVAFLANLFDFQKVFLTAKSNQLALSKISYIRRVETIYFRK